MLINAYSSKTCKNINNILNDNAYNILKGVLGRESETASDLTAGINRTSVDKFEKLCPANG